ncbi:MAG: DNA mismatch repair endonuclease MutL [Spirochaetaceae bacterium]
MSSANLPSPRRPIRILDDAVARRIAAGAGSIEVRLRQGGLEEIVVQDDGSGMPPEDLELCWYSHATSKIAGEADLETATSLGFRGEALASIASVSRLEIISRPPESDAAQRLLVVAGRREASAAAAGAPGTRIAVSGLFADLPARRRFLRRPATESRMIRDVFLEKALAFPEIGFRLFSDGALRDHLPPEGRIERIKRVFPELVDLREVSGSGPGFEVVLVTPGPALWRNDRKLIQSFVNRRRIWEYAFVQAAEYGFQGYLPGGRHPVVFTFLSLSPELVDFNVHPAKREARFKDLPTIHRRITETLRSLSHSFDLRAAGRSPSPEGLLAFDRLPRDPGARDRGAGPWGGGNGPWGGGTSTGGPPDGGVPARPERANLPAAWSTSPRGEAGAPLLPSAGARQGGPKDQAFDLSRALELPPASGRLRYLGQLFGVFLLGEMDDVFYIVDQHAAHERLLYEKIARNSPAQRLLHPIPLDLEEEMARYLENQAPRLAEIGVELRKNEEDGTWEIAAVPASASGSPRALADTLTNLDFDEGNLKQEFFAILACKAAIKEGDRVDPATAQAILEETFALDNARCPHGRPVWHAISREELYRLVGRIP